MTAGFFIKAILQSLFRPTRVCIYAEQDRKKSGPAAYAFPDTPNAFIGSLLSPIKWEYVRIPHDYILFQDCDKNENCSFGYFRYENAWYRKHFSLPENSENKRILLRFDGIAGKSVIYLNGCLMKHNFSSYNTFEIDITDYVYFEKKT